VPEQREVNTLAFSPDGRLLAVGTGQITPGKQPRLTIWDVQTGRLVHQLSRGKWVLSLAFSADGRTLASGHNDNKIRIWEIASGGQRLAIDHGDRPAVLAFSPDGALLASACNQNPRRDLRSPDDEKVRLWHPLTGARLHTLAGHRGPVASLAFSPDGRLLASGSNDTTVLLWDAMNLPRPAQPPRAVAVAIGELEARWADLIGVDAARACLSMKKLLATPGPTLALLQKRLRLVPVERKRATKLLADLDSDDFATREKASKELARLGPAAEPALRRALAARPPLEALRRIEKLLRGLERQYLGVLRGVEVLERLNTAEARKLLSALAGGDKQARVTREATQALARLRRHSRGS
jgi:dipeptidyl aminopeptidase/acylaminoacyl peptidase